MSYENTLETLIASSQEDSYQTEVIYLDRDASYTYIRVDVPLSEQTLGAPLLGASYYPFLIGFSNFADLIAFEDFEGIFRISDLMVEHPIQIYSDPELSPMNSTVILTWTPDDQHLLIDPIGAPKPALIFHLQTGEIEEWNYVCDRVAMSERSKKLAVWCVSNQDLSEFAVLEWGGEIWYAQQPPEQEIFRAREKVGRSEDELFRLFNLYRNAGWSSDGERIAYYDPQDKTGSLMIIDSVGDIQMRIPGKAYWLTEFYQERDFFDGHPIKWSKGNRRILIAAVGDTKKPCPEEVLTLIDRKYVNPGCWQVVDASTGDILWHLADLVAQESEGRLSLYHTYEDATISSDGAYLTIYSFAAADIKFFIIDIETGEIIFDPPLRLQQSRWGPLH
jgi:hypothetical protein